MIIKEKTLSLIVFWNYFFSTKKDLLPNFDWYFKVLQSKDIDLPPYQLSVYLEDQNNKEINRETSPQIITSKLNPKEE